MPVDMAALTADLAAESAVTRALVAGLDEAGWRTPTPAVGWDIADQISHLAYFDEVTVRSAVDPEQFKAELAAAEADGGINPDTIAARFRDRTGAQLLAWFEVARADLLGTFSGLDPAPAAAVVRPGHERRVVADRPDHGDLGAHPGHRRRPRRHPRADAEAAPRRAHRRRRPRVQLRRPRENPAARPVRVELTGPDGALWTWGPEDAGDRVTGPALDFCLLVTQRRHRDDLALSIDGPAATEWMTIAQAFAGTAGTGRSPQRLRRRTDAEASAHRELLRVLR